MTKFLITLSFLFSVLTVFSHAKEDNGEIIFHLTREKHLLYENPRGETRQLKDLKEMDAIMKQRLKHLDATKAILVFKCDPQVKWETLQMPAKVAGANGILKLDTRARQPHQKKPFAMVTDVNVKPTIAKKEDKEIENCVTFIIRKGKRYIYWPPNGDKMEMANLEEVKKMIRTRVEQSEEKLSLDLMSAKEVEWKDIQPIKKLAAQEGIIKISFSILPEAKE